MSEDIKIPKISQKHLLGIKYLSIDDIDKILELAVFFKLRNKEKMYGFGESTMTKDGKPINFFNLGFKNQWENLLPKEMSDKIKDEFINELKDLEYE